jgi:hypothetical protein
VGMNDLGAIRRNIQARQLTARADLHGRHAKEALS